MASNSFLYSNAIMAKWGAQSLAFKSVTDRQTDKQTDKKLNVFGRPVRTARTYGPYVRPVRTGAFLTPVITARRYGCRKCTRTYRTYGPYCIDGPYVPYVRVHFSTPVTRTFGP